MKLAVALVLIPMGVVLVGLGTNLLVREYGLPKFLRALGDRLRNAARGHRA